MKKKHLILPVIICTAAVVLSACGNPEEFSGDENLTSSYTRSDDTSVTYNYADGAESSPNDYSEYSAQTTDFELKMFRNYHKSSEKSEQAYVFCPVGTVLNLTAAANGASGDTQDEILDTVSGGLRLDSANECASYFASRIQAVAKASSKASSGSSGSDMQSFVRLDNALLINNTADVKTSFLQSIKNYYDTDVFRFDFGGEFAKNKVDSAFSYYGVNSGDDFITSGVDFTVTDFSYEADSLASVSAADLCDSWLNPYAQSDLETGAFSGSNGETEVTYMTSNETYMHSSNAQAVMKYLSQTPLKMMFILPNEDVSIDDYISDFTSLEYNTLLDSVDVTKSATAKIPEFSIDGGKEDENMTDVLKKSGLDLTFSDDGEYENLSRTDGFVFDCASEITPALSVNAGGVGGLKSNDSAPQLETRTEQLAEGDVTVEFNRPFVYIILDNESDIPLYIGVYD